MITLDIILKTLFKYSTENKEREYNSEILNCLRKISEILKKEKVNNEIQHFFLENGSRKGANLFAYNPKHKGPVILFQGHVDTVPSGNLNKIKIGNKYVQGRGAVDMKGSLSSMIQAFVSLYGSNLNYSPALLITADEEIGGFLGINNFFKKNKNFLKTIRLVINGEPTNLKVVTKFRGVLSYKIEKIGEKSHSAYPKKHLLEEMVSIIDSIKIFLDKTRKIDDNKLGRTIGAFTVLNSGDKSNVLPEKFKASFNLRTVKRFEVYDNIFTEVFNKLLDKEIKISNFHYDPIEVDLKNEFEKAIRISLHKNKIKYTEDVATFFTEANIFNRKGIPSISIGPGNPKLAHVDSKKEIILKKDLKKYCSFLIGMMHALDKNS